jgi:hypothetical protein
MAPDTDPTAPRPTLPPRLAALQSQVGAHRYGRKVLVYGRYKTGKSYLATTAPGPILAAACGEDGISQYLNKARGDVCIQILSPDDLMAFVEFARQNEHFFKSVVVDNADLLWAEWMDFHEEKLGRELQAKDWRVIKSDWKVFLYRSNRALFNFIQTCGLRDVRYETEGNKVTGVHAQEIPAAEKNIPRVADFIFQTDVLKDKLMKPTEWHTLTYMGGRRPRSIPPEELFTGRTWKFSSKKDNDVWGQVIAPLDAKWSEGAVDYLGIDPYEAQSAEASIRATGEDELVGRMRRLIEECPDEQYTRQYFETNIAPELLGAAKGIKDRIISAHTAKKAAVAAGGKK